MRRIGDEGVTAMGAMEEFGFEPVDSVPDADASRGPSVMARYEDAVGEFKESGETCVKMRVECDRQASEVARWRTAAKRVGGVKVSKRGDDMYLSLGEPERKKTRFEDEWSAKW